MRSTSYDFFPPIAHPFTHIQQRLQNLIALRNRAVHKVTKDTHTRTLWGTPTNEYWVARNELIHTHFTKFILDFHDIRQRQQIEEKSLCTILLKIEDYLKNPTPKAQENIQAHWEAFVSKAWPLPKKWDGSLLAIGLIPSFIAISLAIVLAITALAMLSFIPLGQIALIGFIVGVVTSPICLLFSNQPYHSIKMKQRDAKKNLSHFFLQINAQNTLAQDKNICLFKEIDEVFVTTAARRNSIG